MTDEQLLRIIIAGTALMGVGSALLGVLLGWHLGWEAAKRELDKWRRQAEKWKNEAFKLENDLDGGFGMTEEGGLDEKKYSQPPVESRLHEHESRHHFTSMLLTSKCMRCGVLRSLARAGQAPNCFPKLSERSDIRPVVSFLVPADLRHEFDEPAEEWGETGRRCKHCGATWTMLINYSAEVCPARESPHGSIAIEPVLTEAEKATEGCRICGHKCFQIFNCHREDCDRDGKGMHWHCYMDQPKGDNDAHSICTMVGCYPE